MATGLGVRYKGVSPTVYLYKGVSPTVYLYKGVSPTVFVYFVYFN